jgi:hypothetical protein
MRDADEVYERELRAERDQLLTAYAAVDTRAALLEFQLQLAAAIESRESAAFRLKNPEARQHLRLLRLLGDGLAWQLLHPYAIRQLAKNTAPPPALGNQGDGFRQTLDAARELTANGRLVLVSDLTHCLTIGDLVICDDRERPSIVECGGHEEFLHKGRKARQLQRAQAVIDVLKDGTAVFPGHDRATRTIEIVTRSRETWAVVDRVVLAAERKGSATELANNDDLVFALRADNDPPADAMHELTNHMAEPTFAIYTRLLERPDPRVPPCVAWDVSPAAKRLLYHGDVVVGHVVDVAAFLGRRSGNAEIVKVLRSADEVTGFGVVVGDDRLTFSHEFLTDVLLGFATIESTAEAILEAAQRTIDLAEGWVRSEDLGNDEECDRLAKLADDDGFVTPLTWSELNRGR